MKNVLVVKSWEERKALLLKRKPFRPEAEGVEEETSSVSYGYYVHRNGNKSSMVPNICQK